MIGEFVALDALINWRFGTFTPPVRQSLHVCCWGMNGLDWDADRGPILTHNRHPECKPKWGDILIQVNSFSRLECLITPRPSAQTQAARSQLQAVVAVCSSDRAMCTAKRLIFSERRPVTLTYWHVFKANSLQKR